MLTPFFGGVENLSQLCREQNLVAAVCTGVCVCVRAWLMDDAIAGKRNLSTVKKTRMSATTKKQDYIKVISQLALYTVCLYGASGVHCM